MPGGAPRGVGRGVAQEEHSPPAPEAADHEEVADRLSPDVVVLVVARPLPDRPVEERRGEAAERGTATLQHPHEEPPGQVLEGDVAAHPEEARMGVERLDELLAAGRLRAQSSLLDRPSGRQPEPGQIEDPQIVGDHRHPVPEPEGGVSQPDRERPAVRVPGDERVDLVVGAGIPVVVEELLEACRPAADVVRLLVAGHRQSSSLPSPGIMRAMPPEIPALYRPGGPDPEDIPEPRRRP